MKQLKNYTGIILLITNIFLLIIFIVVQDPFSIFSKTYDKSPRIVEFKPVEIKKVEIEMPEKEIKYILERISFNSEKPVETIADYINRSSWSYRIIQKDKQLEFSVDKDNFKSFLENVMDLRKYYSLHPTTENLSTAEIHNNNIKIKFMNERNKEIVLQVGYSSTRNNFTYIFLPSDQLIYQVESNLKNYLGMDDIYYFRNHYLFSQIEKENIRQILLNHNLRRIKITKAGSDWQLLEPTVGKIETLQFDSILNDIVNLKVNQFYEQENPRSFMKEYQGFNASLEFHYGKEIGETQIYKIEILGKKDYGKYLIKYNNQFYEVSFFRFDDLLEPDKLLEKK